MTAATIPSLPQDDFARLTPGECAAILRISPQTLERWRLLGAKIGPTPSKDPHGGKRTKVFYLAGDIRAYLKATRQTGDGK